MSQCTCSKEIKNHKLTVIIFLFILVSGKIRKGLDLGSCLSDNLKYFLKILPMACYSKMYSNLCAHTHLISELSKLTKMFKI